MLYLYTYNFFFCIFLHILELFLELILKAYSSKTSTFKVVGENEYHLIPINLGGDLDINLKSADGEHFIEYMRETFHNELNYLFKRAKPNIYKIKQRSY